MGKKLVLKMLKNPKYKVRIRVVSRPADVFTDPYDYVEVGYLYCKADTDLPELEDRYYDFYVEVIEVNPCLQVEAREANRCPKAVPQHCERHSGLLPDWAYDALPD